MLARADEELVARFRAGEMEAFAAIFARYQRGVHRFICRLAGRESADDLTQDTFVRAFLGLRAGRLHIELRPWIYRDPVALSRAATPPAGAESPSAEDCALKAEEVRRLESVLASLSEAHRTVLVLRDGEGMSYREISRVIQVSEASVKSLIYRARREFRARYLSAGAGRWTNL